MAESTDHTCPEYRNILNQAAQKYTENRTYIKKLRKVKSGTVDQMMRDFHDSVFSYIDCLKCSNCCRGTGPLLRERDIVRLSRHFKMKPGVFCDTFLKIDEDGDAVFRELPCPFILQDNFCVVYPERPGACRDYPHSDTISLKKYSSQMLENTKICPALFLIFEEMKKRLPL